MGRGSPICKRVRKKIVEYFKNNTVLQFHFQRKCPEKKKIGKVPYDRGNHFTLDYLTNECHFNAGFLQKLILKGGSIPTPHE